MRNHFRLQYCINYAICLYSRGLRRIGGGSKVVSSKTASEEHLRERRSSTEPLPGHVTDPTLAHDVRPAHEACLLIAPDHTGQARAHTQCILPVHAYPQRGPTHHPPALRVWPAHGRVGVDWRWLCRACRCMPAWASAPGMRWMRARSGTLLRVHVFCAISLSPEDRRHRNRIGDLNTFDRLLEGFANWLRKSCLACSLIYLSVNAHITRAQVLSANLRGDCSLR
jgi:hypothetical protein